MDGTGLSGSDLAPFVCQRCGIPLAAGPDAALLVCPVCGLAHELVAGALSTLTPLIAQETTALALTGEVHHLAAWRLVVEVDDEPGDATWAQIARRAGGGRPYLYVPAFSPTRSVLHRLGFRLTEMQPLLEPAAERLSAVPAAPEPLGRGTLELPATRAALSAQPHETAAPDASGFGVFSPIVISRHDARILSHFVYLVLRSGDTRELSVVDYRLDVIGEQLVYIPAVWDERCVHDAGWRLLLREFDDLVA